MSTLYKGAGINSENQQLPDELQKPSIVKFRNAKCILLLEYSSFLLLDNI